MNQTPCSICQEGGHAPRRCPTLCDPLKNEFYKPSGGRPVGGDDEEDTIKRTETPTVSCPLQASLLVLLLPMKL